MNAIQKRFLDFASFGSVTDIGGNAAKAAAAEVLRVIDELEDPKQTLQNLVQDIHDTQSELQNWKEALMHLEDSEKKTSRKETRPELEARAQRLINLAWEEGLTMREDARFYLAAEARLKSATDEEILEDISFMEDQEARDESTTINED